MPLRMNMQSGRKHKSKLDIWENQWSGSLAAPLIFCYPLTKYFEMSELCNNSACFSVEIKDPTDICVTFVVYACSKSILGVRTYEKDTADRRQRHLYMVSVKIFTTARLPGRNGFHTERRSDSHPRGNASGNVIAMIYISIKKA